VAGQDICVYEVSTAGTSLLATIKNPVPGPGKPSHVQFGHGDGEVIVFSTHGLKVLVFELSTAKAVEVASPKWYHPASAPRAYSVRPLTGHLALFTRVGGKDMLSIHDPSSRQLQRSWHPETNDVQGVAWSPDGQWLLTVYTRLEDIVPLTSIGSELKLADIYEMVEFETEVDVGTTFHLYLPIRNDSEACDE
jgi:dipeptidyl aminopeptidase/acylaminoacyl peptidase